VWIDVEPAGTAAAGDAAAELARSLRQVTGRLEAICPVSPGTAVLPAWAATWARLRIGLLALAATGEQIAASSRAAVTRYRETESGLMVPDGH
jgi:hypothetical protein